MKNQPELRLPALASLGMEEVATGRVFDPPAKSAAGVKGSYGRLRPVSAGNDSMSGHWELAGAPVTTPFATFDEFPPELTKAIENEAGVKLLGNRRLGAREAMDTFGPEHLKTGALILFTSSSSALQLAAHEARMSPGELYRVARVARRLADEWRIGRVITRPFTGSPGAWLETGERHDLTMPPPRTVFNAIAEAGLRVEAVGKVGELFAQSGITRSIPAATNRAALAAVDVVWKDPHDGLLVANLSDFDLYGHRRDSAGFAEALREFDKWLSRFLPTMEDDDLLIITSDHGNDPTFSGTDHTREEVPVLLLYDSRMGPVGLREGFGDVAATLRAFFALPGGSPAEGTPLITFHRPPPGIFPPV